VLFAVTRLNLSLNDLYRITWAEFELRSFGFWQQWKDKKISEAKLNWRIYCQWNDKAKPFDSFLQKEYGIKIPKGKKQTDRAEAMIEALKQYQKDIENG